VGVEPAVLLSCAVELIITDYSPKMKSPIPINRHALVRPILPLPQRVSGSEPFCTEFRKAMSESIDASGEQFDPSNQTAYLPLEAELAQTRWFAGHGWMFISRNPQPGSPSSGRAPRQGRPRWHASAGKRNEMHPEDLMKPDLFSELVLLGSGGLIFVSLLLIVAAALTRA
jgi:hypothetical protein